MALRTSIRTIEIFVKAVPITARKGIRLNAMIAMMVGMMAGKSSTIAALADARPMADLHADAVPNLHQIALCCRCTIGENCDRPGKIEVQVERGARSERAQFRQADAPRGQQEIEAHRKVFERIGDGRVIV